MPIGRSYIGHDYKMPIGRSVIEDFGLEWSRVAFVEDLYIGVCSYCLYSYGIYSYGLCSYGLYSYGLSLQVRDGPCTCV